MAWLPGNVSAAQLTVAEALRQAGFELDEDNEGIAGSLRTILAVLADGRSVQRLGSGEWVVLRDYGLAGTLMVIHVLLLTFCQVFLEVGGIG